jgi:hypothetical protein
MMGFLQKSKLVAIYCTQKFLAIKKSFIDPFQELSWFHIT